MEMKGWAVKAGVAILLVAGIWWIWGELSKPIPGQKVQDLGQEHVPDGTKVEYNSNPPTSGSHYADWTRAGVYDKSISDGHLIHSLEHGYVVVSYNCEKLVSIPQSLVPVAYAHKEELVPQATESADATESAQALGGKWESQNCRDLVAKLTTIYEKKGKRKLIVIPRPSLDTRIGLTAWTRIDKFDPSASSGLSELDEKRIERFIDAWRDKGPEKTME